MTIDAYASDLTVSRCAFTGNAGPAMLYEDSGLVEDCIFLENRDSAVTLGGTPDSLRFERCLFLENVGRLGGAVNFYEEVELNPPQFINCVFDRNEAAVFAPCTPICGRGGGRVDLLRMLES